MNKNAAHYITVAGVIEDVVVGSGGVVVGSGSGSGGHDVAAGHHGSVSQ